jgi:hypothetical protein
MPQLEDDIKAAVHFHKTSATGFNTLKCPVCNDQKVRAGFRFDSDKIVYNCFRGKCDASTEYVYGQPMYKKFRHLLDVIGVRLDAKTALESKQSKYKTPKTILDPELYDEHKYETLELYKSFEEYNPKKHWWFQRFLYDRHADFKRDLYVGTKEPHKNQLIIPFYYNHKLIGWQGVSVYENGKTFYQTSSENSDLIYINQGNGTIPKIPIIVEGIMDAVVLPNGIATLGNSVSKKQAYFLRNSDPILLPDRKGSKYLEVAKRYGWRISIPNWKEKDVNEVVKRYGKFIAARMIYEGIEKNLVKAETKYKIWRQR